MLLVGTTKSGATVYAKRIRTIVERHASEHGRLTASLRVAALPDDAQDADELLHAAQGAVVQAKRLGRNPVVAR